MIDGCCCCNKRLLCTVLLLPLAPLQWRAIAQWWWCWGWWGGNRPNHILQLRWLSGKTLVGAVLCEKWAYHWPQILFQFNAHKENEAISKYHSKQNPKICPLPPLGLNTIDLFHNITPRNIRTNRNSIQHKVLEGQSKKVILVHSLSKINKKLGVREVEWSLKFENNIYLQNQSINQHWINSIHFCQIRGDTNLKSIHIKTHVRKWVTPQRLGYIFWQSEETSYQHEDTLHTTQPEEAWQYTQPQKL